MSSRVYLDCSVLFTEFKPFPLELQVKFSLGPTNLPPICPCFHSSRMLQPCSVFFSFSSLTLFEEILLLNLSWKPPSQASVQLRRKQQRFHLYLDFANGTFLIFAVTTLTSETIYAFIVRLLLTYDLQRLRTSFATFAAGKFMEQPSIHSPPLSKPGWRMEGVNQITQKTKYIFTNVTLPGSDTGYCFHYGLL